MYPTVRLSSAVNEWLSERDDGATQMYRVSSVERIRSLLQKLLVRTSIFDVHETFRYVPLVPSLYYYATIN